MTPNDILLSVLTKKYNRLVELVLDPTYWTPYVSRLKKSIAKEKDDTIRYWENLQMQVGKSQFNCGIVEVGTFATNFDHYHWTRQTSDDPIQDMRFKLTNVKSRIIAIRRCIRDLAMDQEQVRRGFFLRAAMILVSINEQQTFWTDIIKLFDFEDTPWKYNQNSGNKIKAYIWYANHLKEEKPAKGKKDAAVSAVSR